MLVILSSEHKEVLVNNPSFLKHVKWAVLDKAAYWIGLDGTSFPGGVSATTLERWRKSKTYAKAIQASPSIAEDIAIAKRFVSNYIKNITCIDSTVTIDLFDSAAQDTVIQYLLDDGSVDHISNFDTMADKWFDDQISTNL